MTNIFQTTFNSQKIWAHHILPSALICKEHHSRWMSLWIVINHIRETFIWNHQKISTLMHTMKALSLSTELQHCHHWLLPKILKLALAQASTIFLFAQPQAPSVPWVCLARAGGTSSLQRASPPRCPIYCPFFPKTISGFLQSRSFLKWNLRGLVPYKKTTLRQLYLSICTENTRLLD